MAYITRIRIEQCRNVRDLEIDLSASSAEGEGGDPAAPRFRHLILTGPNGLGKSGILEEVAGHCAMLLHPRPDTALSAVKRTVEWDQPLERLFNRGHMGRPFAVYLRARRSIQHQEVAGASKLDLEPRNLPPNAPASAKFLQFLVNKRMEIALAAEDNDTETVRRTREWFATFEGHVRRLTEDDGLTLTFDRKAYNFSFHRSDGYSFDINTLADGHASILSILAELLIRIEVLCSPDNGVSTEPEGVVIIDEIETHLHLSLQEKVLPFLTEIFPRLQFIVATHSPAVICSIPNAVVYDLRLREATLSDRLRGIRYGTLMTEHFGISSDIDLDTTEKLVRARDLARRDSRTPEQQKELELLTSMLLARSPATAMELWAARERIGEPDRSNGTRAARQSRLHRICG